MNLKSELREDLIDKLSIGIILVNQKGEFVFANNVIQKMTGYTEKEVNSLTTWYEKVFPNPEKRKKVKKIFKSDIKNDIPDRTHKITTAAGEHKYLNFRYSELEAGMILFEIIDISHKIKQKQQLKKQKIIFENLFTNSLAGIVLLDRDLNILEANKKFKEIFEVAEERLINKNINQIAVPVSSSDRIKQKKKFFLQGRKLKEYAAYRVNDQIKYCNIHIFSALDDEHGNLIYAALNDITENKKREFELKEVKERLELAVEGANIGIWDWKVEQEIVHYNHNWAQMLGYELSELDNCLDTWLDLVHPDDKSRVLRDINNHLSGKTEKYFNEHRLKSKSGKWKWIRDIGKVTERDEQGAAVRVVGVHIDIDREKRTAKKIEYLSNHDELTGLYNRRYFNEELKRLHNSRKYPVSIIVGDLNSLKQINDNYGHSMGDRYIKMAAEAVKNSLRVEDVLARIGGDEFAVILPETDNQEAAAVTNRILKSIKKYNSKQLPEPLSIALGYATTYCSNPDCGEKDIINCYNQADRNMYKQKFGSRG
jgi:diguanylate cyclase (GGDEF)-like protein/PAS domain S-box-containing protein